MTASLKIVLGLVLLGSALSFKIQHPITPSGFFKGSRLEHPDGAIYNGKEAGKNQFPHQVVVYTTQSNGDKFICGGCLISAEYIVTAAHCPRAGVSVEIILGAHNRKDTSEPSQVRRKAKVGTKHVIIHEDFRPIKLENDIAVIRMDPPIDFTSAIEPIPLSPSEPPAGTVVILSGWGATGDGLLEGPSSTLQYAKVTVTKDAICEDFYTGNQDMKNIICLDPSQLNGASSCGGDSGGPLNYMMKDGVNRLGGITSYGSRTCTKGFPIGYTCISCFLDWIKDATGVTP